MVEWLKEQVLFDHLLHGLFKFLSENTGIRPLDNDVEGSSGHLCTAVWYTICTCFLCVRILYCMRLYMKNLTLQTFRGFHF